MQTNLPLLLLFFSFFSGQRLMSQTFIRGQVFDKTKITYVEQVRVVSTSGQFSVTDSFGRYQILAYPYDSLIFHYQGKPTMKFAVSQVQDPDAFNISLGIVVSGKYSLMKEVVVVAKSYREDSLENRAAYSKIFGYKKPGLQSSMSPTGVAGADLTQLINLFRFRYNKRMKSFRERLEEEEKEKSIDYRFNKTTVRRITGLQGPALDSFLVWYRPGYEFAADSDEITFNQYVLNAWYHYQKLGYGTDPVQSPSSPAKNQNR